MRNLKRRDFLKLASLAGLGLAAPMFGSLLDSRNPRSADEVEVSTYALGTMISIKVEDAITPINARAAVDKSLQEIKRLESIFTRFDPSNDLARLNASGFISSPQPDLVDILKLASHYSIKTEGAFDVTVKPVLDLFHVTSGNFVVPTEAEFDAAKNLIDFQKISVSTHSVSFDRTGMGATLDCLAKGYILDKAAAVLRKHGVRSALIDGGGSLVAVGSRWNGAPWRIGIRDPTRLDESIGTIALSNQAVATSGDYENTYTQDRRYYHIINPHTARSPLYSHSATVIAGTATEADPLAVALMVGDPSDAQDLIDRSVRCECLIVTRDHGIVKSNRFDMI